MVDVSAQNMDLSGSLAVVGNASLGDVSCANLEISGNVIIQSDEMTVSAYTFNTIVIRRPSGVTGPSSTYHINLNELQLWIDGSNVLVNVGLGPSNNTSGNTIGETTEFINWSTKQTDEPGLNKASNLFNGTISATYDVHSYGTTSASTTSVYIPISTTYNINDIQSCVLYNKIGGASERVIGLAIELYNRDNDPSLNTPLITTPEIDVDRDIYRFDFPSTYPDVSYVSSFSATNMIDSSSSAVYNVLSKKTVTKEAPIVTIIPAYTEERLFDTIVIRRPTGYNTADMHINLLELQCWINNSNTLTEGSTATFNYWTTKSLMSAYNTDTEASNLYTGTFTDGVHTGAATVDGCIIISITQRNINDIQSLVLYNSTWTPTYHRAQGLAIELYYRENDPSLNQILTSTKIINQAVDVYRFDFQAINTYTNEFSAGSSPTQIISSSYATIEITESPNDAVVLALDNCKMGVTHFKDIYVGGVNINDHIIASRFSTRQIITNVIDVFTSDPVTNSSDSFVLATNIPVYGGTLIINFSLGGFGHTTGLAYIWLYIETTSGTILKTMETSIWFNQTSVHHAWNRVEVFTGIAAQNIRFRVERNDVPKCSVNDFFSITLQEMPY